MVAIVRALANHGVDAVECSAGGVAPGSAGWPPQYPGFQVAYAERIMKETGVPTIAVGRITAPEFADEIIRNGRAAMVALGRELLRNPYWPLRAAAMLGSEIGWPGPYVKAREGLVP